MKQILPAMFLVALAAAWAQTPPARPAPPPPQAPVAVPAPALQPLPPLPPAAIAGQEFDFDFDFSFDFEPQMREKMELAREEMQRAREEVERDKMTLRGAFAPQAMDRIREELEASQKALGKLDLEQQMKLDALREKLGNMAFFQGPTPAPRAAIAYAGRRSDDEERMYRDGKRDIEDKDYEDALEEFARVIEKKGSRADAALYWRAYTLNKMGRRTEALEALAEMERTYPKSRWLDDAKALALEVKQSSGQPVSPDAESNEDLKVLAVQGLIHSDPERGIPVLEKILTTAGNPRLRERALFVLAQTNNDKGRELLIQLARSATNPDLQLKAVEYLGYQKDPEIKNVLAGIYTGTTDSNIKRSVLRAYTATRDKDRLLEAARSESQPELRREAVRGLGALRADTELWQLFDAETTPDLKVDILRALPNYKEGSDRLVQLAKTERDPTVRRELIRQLGYSRNDKHTEALVALYNSETDEAQRRFILEALRHQQNAKAVVDLARAETDPKMKRMLIEALTHMKSKEATDYLLEVLSK